MDRDVEIQEVLATTSQKASALEDPVRAELLDMLAHDAMSVAEMVQALAEGGQQKAPTTVRHHLDVLREAGLIALKRLEENRGGVIKYYAATTRLLDFPTPEGFEEQFEEPIETMAGQLEDAVGRLREEHGEALREMATSLKPCPYCETAHFEEYVIARVLQAALARTMQTDA